MADKALAPLLAQWPGAQMQDGPAITRISAVGAGMPATPGTAARIFRALAKEQINIKMIFFTPSHDCNCSFSGSFRSTTYRCINKMYRFF